MYVYEQNMNTAENDTVFDNFTNLLRRVLRAIIIQCSVTWVGFVTVPAILYWTSGKREPIFPWIFPGTSLNTTTGYVFNYVQQFYMISTCALGAYALFALYFSLLILHVILMVNIMRNKLARMDQAAMKKGAEWDIRINMRNLMLLHNETRA